MISIVTIQTNYDPWSGDPTFEAQGVWQAGCCDNCWEDEASGGIADCGCFFCGGCIAMTAHFYCMEHESYVSGIDYDFWLAELRADMEAEEVKWEAERARRDKERK